MIQFNLLPDVKLEYIKARRTKRLVILVSTIVAGASIAITVVLFIGTNVLQRQHLDHLTDDIDRDSKSLEHEEDLNKILTVQNQLGVLDELHAQKPAAARMGTYLSQIVPDNVTLTRLEANFTENTMTFDGTAGSLSAVNKFIDTLKFTTYKTEKSGGEAFSSVVLSSFGRTDQDDDSTQAPATFQITLNFDVAIFNIKEASELIVPSTVSTRSAIESPTSPFQSNGHQEEQ